MDNDGIVRAIDDLTKQVNALTTKVTTLERRWQWITSAALIVVGAVGGPDAVAIVTGGAA